MKPAAIRPIGETVLPYGINLAIYGNPGIGKTPLIATSPKCLILDADDGTASASGSGADVWTVKRWKDMDEVYEYLRHEKHGYQWVWWDGVSMGQDTLLEDVMINLIKPVSQGGGGKSHRKTYLVDKGEYGENMQRIKQWVRHMKGLPCNFGMTAHPSPSIDEASDDEKLWPWIQGRNMPQTVCANFDVIAFCMKEEDGKLKMYVQEGKNYYARDRFGALADGIISPTIPKIEALIRAKLGIKATTPAIAPVAAPATKSGLRPVTRK